MSANHKTDNESALLHATRLLGRARCRCAHLLIRRGGGLRHPKLPSEDAAHSGGGGGEHSEERQRRSCKPKARGRVCDESMLPFIPLSHIPSLLLPLIVFVPSLFPLLQCCSGETKQNSTACASKKKHFPPSPPHSPSSPAPPPPHLSSKLFTSSFQAVAWIVFTLLPPRHLTHHRKRQRREETRKAKEWMAF